MVFVFHVSELGILGDADFVMWTKNQTSSFAFKKVSDGLDLISGRFLLRDVVVQTKHQQRVGVCEYAFIEWKFEAGLNDALKEWNCVTRCFAYELLERRERPEEE